MKMFNSSKVWETLKVITFPSIVFPVLLHQYALTHTQTHKRRLAVHFHTRNKWTSEMKSVSHFSLSHICCYWTDFHSRAVVALCTAAHLSGTDKSWNNYHKMMEVSCSILRGFQLHFISLGQYMQCCLREQKPTTGLHCNSSCSV